MADRSPIEWTEATWNPARGCTRVSEGCRNCYAEGIAARFSGPGLAYEGLATREGGRARWTGKLSFGHDLEAPLRWRRPRRIFVNSMSDLFHEATPNAEIDRIFAIMALCSQHTFQVLTKRPARMRAYMAGPAHVMPPADSWSPWPGGFGTTRLEAIRYAASLHGLERERVETLPLPNVWLGTSCEDQATADARVPELLATPAAVRFVSAEPLLGPIHFGYLGWPSAEARVRTGHNALLGARYADGHLVERLPALDWIIVGGESGPHARPMHPAWARSIRHQCALADVAFFHKQNGEFRTVGPIFGDEPVFDVDERRCVIVCRDGSIWPDEGGQPPAGAWMMERVGKKAAGRLLDGVAHDGMPEAPHA